MVRPPGKVQGSPAAAMAGDTSYYGMMPASQGLTGCHDIEFNGLNAEGN
jgi:hypothetical protein